MLCVRFASPQNVRSSIDHLWTGLTSMGMLSFGSAHSTSVLEVGVFVPAQRDIVIAAVVLAVCPLYAGENSKFATRVLSTLTQHTNAME
ncbi:hypothetical protein OF83DRAFT_1144792 [Amylostereum chailletii]|nr:hypothetical protein OF83DRAFT_1144792 [Amylostereum chailletii]